MEHWVQVKLERKKMQIFVVSVRDHGGYHRIDKHFHLVIRDPNASSDSAEEGVANTSMNWVVMERGKRPHRNRRWFICAQIRIRVN
jgi:hypothetical protein